MHIDNTNGLFSKYFKMILRQYIITYIKYNIFNLNHICVEYYDNHTVQISFTCKHLDIINDYLSNLEINSKLFKANLDYIKKQKIYLSKRLYLIYFDFRMKNSDLCDLDKIKDNVNNFINSIDIIRIAVWLPISVRGDHHDIKDYNDWCWLADYDFNFKILNNIILTLLEAINKAEIQYCK